MKDCEQEACPNWNGDGNVCACELFGMDKPKPVEYSGLDRSFDDWAGMGWG